MHFLIWQTFCIKCLLSYNQNSYFYCIMYTILLWCCHNSSLLFCFLWNGSVSSGKTLMNSSIRNRCVMIFYVSFCEVDLPFVLWLFNHIIMNSSVQGTSFDLSFYTLEENSGLHLFSGFPISWPFSICAIKMLFLFINNSQALNEATKYRATLKETVMIIMNEHL